MKYISKLTEFFVKCIRCNEETKIQGQEKDIIYYGDISYQNLDFSFGPGSEPSDITPALKDEIPNHDN